MLQQILYCRFKQQWLYKIAIWTRKILCLMKFLHHNLSGNILYCNKYLTKIKTYIMPERNLRSLSLYKNASLPNISLFSTVIWRIKYFFYFDFSIKDVKKDLRKVLIHNMKGNLVRESQLYIQGLKSGKNIISFSKQFDIIIRRKD